MTTSAAPPPKDDDRLPEEVKLSIARWTHRADRVRLACVSSAWNTVTEETLWADVAIRDGGWVWRVAYTDWVQGIAARWKEILQALQSRPVRQTYLRKLVIASPDLALDTMVDVLELCKSTITEIKQVDLAKQEVGAIFSPQDARALARAIDFVRVLPGLTKLCLQLSDTWEYDLYCALRSCPSLVDLKVTTFKVKTPVVNPDMRPALRLRHLRRFVLISTRWEVGMEMILAAAPPLTEIVLDSRGETNVYTGTVGAMAEILKCSTLRRLEVLERHISGSAIAQMAAGTSVKSKLEGLRELAVCHPLRLFGPGCLLEHPTLTSLTLYHPSLPPLFEWYCGTLSAGYTTGLIAPWLVDLIQGLPALRRLAVAQIPSLGHKAHPEESLFFHICTYPADGDILFVLSVHSTWTGCPLGPHSLGHRDRAQSSRQGGTGASYAPQGSENSVASPGMLTSADPQGEQPDPRYGQHYWAIYDDDGVECNRHSLVTLTSYRGHSLPFALMDRIRPGWDCNDCTADKHASEREGRDLELSESSRRLLQEWSATLCA